MTLGQRRRYELYALIFVMGLVLGYGLLYLLWRTIL